MSVRKRRWVTRTGEEREAWIVDYVDQSGARHIETFGRKKDADAYHASVTVDVAKGVHTAPSRSLTVREAAADWLTFVMGEGRERTTLRQYRTHVDMHITPRVGNVKLASLSTPRVEAFRDQLLADLSRKLAAKVLVSFKSILKDAARRGNIAQNPARDVTITFNSRSKPRLEIGRDIPTRDEVRRWLEAAPAGRPRALLMVAAFAGLRASELRGLRWADLDLARGELHVNQRADRWNTIGRPKSVAGERRVPIGPLVVNTLRQWKLRCPKGQGDLVFPNGAGRTESHANLAARIVGATQLRAGIIDADGKPKYALHCLRHFYASWCINRRSDGGLELPAKVVQSRLGHANISVTLDVYSHLFPATDDGTELAAAEQAIFAT